MIPLHAIILMLLFQIIGYILLDKYNLNNGKYLIFVLLLSLNFFVLPGYFIPENPTGEPRCGMPALGITLAFWIFGGGLTIIIHLLYVVISNYKNKRKKRLLDN